MILRHRLLAVPHHAIDKLRHQGTVVNRIRKYFASFGNSSSWHIVISMWHRLQSVFLVQVPVSASRFLLLITSRSPLVVSHRTSTTLLAIRNTDRIERSANHVVAHARQVLHAAATNQHDRVLLQIVTNTRDVGRDFDPVGQANASHLAQRRIWLLGRLRIHAGANPTLLRRTLERRAGRLVLDLLASFANKLIYCRHCFPLSMTARIMSAQKGACLPLSGTCPAVSAGDCPVMKLVI